MIGFSGPRDLDEKYRSLVHDVLDLTFPYDIAVGCASGLDQMVVDNYSSLFVMEFFAVFGPDGKGAAKLSNVAGIQRMVRTGHKVHWWAGGNESVPLTKRLSNRSLAMIDAVAKSSGKKGIIAFPNKAPESEWTKYGRWYSCHSGTWGTVASAVAVGLPVIVFKCGEFDLPMLPISGTWTVGGNGLWSNSWKFVAKK